MTTDAISDLARLNFLRALDRSGLPLSAWEQGFLADFRHSSRPSLWFTHRRRQATDRLRHAYGDFVGGPLQPNIPSTPQRAATSGGKMI